VQDTDRAPQTVTGLIYKTMQRYGWLAFFIACLTLSYLLVWQRGLYADDYFFYNDVVDSVSGARQFYLPDRLDRVLHFLVDTNLAGIMPEYEALVRLLAALCTAANALLLGWLVARLVHSRFAAVVAAWFFLAPFAAHEAVLWISAYSYMFSVLCTLLCLHAAVTVLTRERRWRRWALAAITCYAAAVGFGEQAALSVILLPLLAIVLLRQERSAGPRRAATRSIAMVVAMSVIAAAIVWFGYRTSSLVMPRGGMDLSIGSLAQKTLEFMNRLLGLTIRPNTGLRLTIEAGKLGVHKLLDAPPAMLVFVAAAILLLVTARTWQSEGSSRMPARATLGAGAACAWFVASALIPGIAIPNQILAPRMLYIPLAGLSVAGALLAWRLASRFVPERLVLLAAGAIVLVSSVCMLGYDRAYEARSQLDQRQLATLRQALPARYLPQGAYVVAIDVDERLFGHSDGMSNVMLGLLQSRWSAPRAMNTSYRRNDLQTVASTSILVKDVAYTEARGAAPAELRVMDTPLPIDKTVIFVYKDGASRIIESLVVRQSDGARLTVRFPVAEKMAADGLPTLRDYVAPIVTAAR
jgi:hypothetical protein